MKLIREAVDLFSYEEGVHFQHFEAVNQFTTCENDCAYIVVI